MELAHRGLFNVVIAPSDKRVDKEAIKATAQSLQNVSAYRWTPKGDCADTLIEILTQMPDKALAVESIDLSEFHVSSKFLETFLAKAQKLERLRCYQWDTSPTHPVREWITIISRNMSFKHLEFSSCVLKPEELAPLSRLPLRSLTLDHFQFLCKEHILVLGGLCSLEDLDIYNFSGDEDSVLYQITQSLPDLKRLNIGDFEGTSQAITHLANMRDLKQFNIREISDEDRSMLTKKFPSIKISSGYTLDDANPENASESDAD
jgi:hypothetical protein